jgi:predicted nucleotidyltransferase component of viral defense system
MNKEQLLAIAHKEAFHVDVLEKTWRLMDLLDLIESNETLVGKFALKGGTALNLFYFNVPRLSVDIDLNYVGSPIRDVFKEERPLLEHNLEAIYKSQLIPV